RERCDPSELARQVRDLENRLADLSQYGDPADLKHRIRELEGRVTDLQGDLERMGRYGSPEDLVRKIKSLELQLEDLTAYEKEQKARLEAEKQRALQQQEEGAAEWANKCDELARTIKMIREEHDSERENFARELSASRTRLTDKEREIDQLAATHRSEMGKLRDAHKRHRAEQEEQLDRAAASGRVILEAELRKKQQEHESALRDLSASHAAD
ncbi:hypothetical protein FOZ63_002586, partial [Perkinsus olseni]